MSARRFVVLRHSPSADEAGGPHWDLMLDTWPSSAAAAAAASACGSADEPSVDAKTLRTWALDGPPADGAVRAARRLPDHRRLYLDYEGPISGDRGSVARWDRGTYQAAHDDEASLRVTLFGEQNVWTVELTRPDSAAVDRWLARFRLGAS